VLQGCRGAARAAFSRGKPAGASFRAVRCLEVFMPDTTPIWPCRCFCPRRRKSMSPIT